MNCVRQDKPYCGYKKAFLVPVKKKRTKKSKKTKKKISEKEFQKLLEQNLKKQNERMDKIIAKWENLNSQLENLYSSMLTDSKKMKKKSPKKIKRKGKRKLPVITRSGTSSVVSKKKKSLKKKSLKKKSAKSIVVRKKPKKRAQLIQLK